MNAQRDPLHPTKPEDIPLDVDEEDSDHNNEADVPASGADEAERQQDA